MDEDRQALLHRDEHAHPGGASGHRSHHRDRSGARRSCASHLARGSATSCLRRSRFAATAIECRINAEHPEKFTPSAGKITAFNVPGGNGVRVDTAQYAEGVVPPYYDSLIAKLIVHGVDRAEAIAKMERALSQFIVQGIDTSIPLHQAIFAGRRLPRRRVRHQVHGAVPGQRDGLNEADLGSATKMGYEKQGKNSPKVA